MRTNLDFTPLFRSSIGYERLFNILEDASRVGTIDSWPPYDIARVGEDDYGITIAVSGFTPDELTITYRPNMLGVSGTPPEDKEGQYLYRGIAARAFEKRFELADHVKVAGVTLSNGLLGIHLKRQVPEEMKPRRVEIDTSQIQPKAEPQLIGSGKKAA